MRVKDLIDALETKYGSLRAAAEALGVSHQNLSNWRKGGKKQKELFEFMERARRDLRMAESKAWKSAVK